MVMQRTVVGERYMLLDSIGHGGMGRVYLARDELLDRDVALKLLKSSARGEPTVRGALSAGSQKRGGPLPSQHSVGFRRGRVGRRQPLHGDGICRRRDFGGADTERSAA